MTEYRIDSELLFRGSFLEGRRDRVRLPDGSQSTREYVLHPGAVMIVPLLESADKPLQVVLERQFRYPVGRTLIEFPAGKLDSGENPQRCAQRELREETGYGATQWAKAGVLHPVVGYCNETIEIWFARQLEAGASDPDPGEFVEVFCATPERLLGWCQEGQVTDGKTLVGAMWLQNVLTGNWPLEWCDALAET